MFAWCKELSVLLKCVKCPNLPSGIKLSNIETIRELLCSPISTMEARALIDVMY